ncbi:restriction endonuclease subunit S [Shewanella xiamenensis]|uniref:restriction endonuclease subunit S n=1 Tax=Shewanella xiamenensis TaxID=332186 RepID=UPI001F060AF3|nr:restriction endonuclease subunit S [Shewanella xiamenensis]UML94188.1 restriction endonuclease subunit S [Shewanella xiamenensis]
MNELPKGWVESTISEITSYVQRGKGPKYSEEVNSFPVINQKAIRWFGIQEEYLKFVKSDTWASYTEERFVRSGDILWNSTGTGTIGRACLLNEKEAAKAKVVDSHVTILRVNSAVEPRYLFYWIGSPKVQFDIESLSTGTTNQVELSKTKVLETKIPLAPLNEQKRIADKLDSILAKVDRAQARLEKIPGILKRFRQSVLTAATSGELTREWREQNGVSISSWEDTVFSKLSREITVGFVGKMSDKYQDSGIKFLRSQNVRAFKFDPKNLLFISPEFHQEIYKSRLEAGDLAVVRSGAPGTTCVIPADLGEANCSDLVIVRPNEKLIPGFGCIFMNSSVAQKNVKENQVGVAQQHFNVGSMKLMPINLPTKLEQAEIVRRVHGLFVMADVVEKNYGDSLVRVNKLKQSILSKAFRGELVEQVSSDEPAEALLNKVKKTRESKNLSSRKTQAFSIENSLREKITLERKDVMSLANAPDDYLLGLLNQLGGEASAETLWSKSGLNIDQFYAKLKQEVKCGDIHDDNSSLDPTLRKLKSVVRKD